MESAKLAEGKLQLVGAGLGRVDLLTVAAYRALQECDVVISDQLVSEDILSIPRSRGIPVHISGNKRRPLKSLECQTRISDVAQEELNSIGLSALQEGKHVVRLKQGDPFLYGRGAEEILHYRQYGFSAEVIPGLSSGLALPVPVTHRGVADQVYILSGNDGCKEGVPKYNCKATVVVLMCVRRLEEIVCMFLKEGYPEDVGCGLIMNAYSVGELVLLSVLKSICGVAEERGVENPAVLVVGGVVGLL